MHLIENEFNSEYFPNRFIDIFYTERNQENRIRYDYRVLRNCFIDKIKAICMHLYNVVLKLEPKFFTQSVTISKENVQKKPVKNHHMPGNMKN